MKVDKNQPAFPRTGSYDSENLAEYDSTSQDGIPLRLEIAARILAGQAGNIGMNRREDENEHLWLASISLQMADALIKAHNETWDFT